MISGEVLREYSWTSQLGFSTGRRHAVHLGKAACVWACIYCAGRGMNNFYLSSVHETTPPPHFIHHLLPNCFPSLVALSRYLKTLSSWFLLFPSLWVCVCVCSIDYHPLSLSQTHTHTVTLLFTRFPLDLNSEAVYLAGKKRNMSKRQVYLKS